MKNYLDALQKRNLIIKAMIMLLWIIPIFIITNNIYIWLYGDYIFLGHSIENIPIHNLYSICIFAIITLFSWFLEKYLLPFILASKKNKLTKELYRKSKINSNIILKKLYGLNTLNSIRMLPIYSYFSELMYVPLIIILWLIALNCIISYIFLIFVIALLYPYAKLLNTVYYESERTE